MSGEAATSSLRGVRSLMPYDMRFEQKEPRLYVSWGSFYSQILLCSIQDCRTTLNKHNHRNQYNKFNHNALEKIYPKELQKNLYTFK